MTNINSGNVAVSEQTNEMGQKMTTTPTKPVCAIVGVGPGIGLAVAKKFAAENFSLALIARNADRVKQMAADANVADAKAYGADARDRASLQSALTTASDDLGPIEVLVYNAAALTVATPTALAPEALEDDMAVSVVGALTALRSVVPTMLSRGVGTVLFTGGGLALYPSSAVTSLSIGKAAIRSLAFCLAEELADDPIRVGMVSVFGTVEPGTPFDPTKIAAAFWEVHTDKEGSLGIEIQFKGRPD